MTYTFIYKEPNHVEHVYIVMQLYINTGYNNSILKSHLAQKKKKN